MWTIFFFPLQLAEEETDFWEFWFYCKGVGIFFGDDRAFYETEILKAACIYKDPTANHLCITSTACTRLFWIQIPIFLVEIFLILVMSGATEGY